jgi:hypothetical protein
VSIVSHNEPAGGPVSNLTQLPLSHKGIQLNQPHPMADDPILGPPDLSNGSQGSRYLSVVFQREFGFVEGPATPGRWQSIRQLPSDAFLSRNCPAPRDIFPVHKLNTLARIAPSKDGFFAEHAERLLTHYSIIPKLQITTDLVDQLVQRMHELRKRVLDYVTAKCNERWAEVLKSGVIRDHYGNPFPDAKRVRTYIKTLADAQYEPFMVAINDHADAMFAARSQARIDLANELMFTHGFQLHQLDFEANQNHTVSLTSFFYVINDGMNNFKSSLKRACRQKKRDLNLSQSRRPTSCIPHMPVTQTTSDVYYQPHLNGAYRQPCFDPYTGQPLILPGVPHHSAGPGGAPPIYPSPAVPFGHSRNGMPPPNHQVPPFNALTQNAGPPEHAGQPSSDQSQSDTSLGDATSDEIKRFRKWERRERRRRKRKKHHKSKRSRRTPKSSRRSRSQSYSGEESTVSGDGRGCHLKADHPRRSSKHREAPRPASLPHSSSESTISDDGRRGRFKGDHPRSGFKSKETSRPAPLPQSSSEDSEDACARPSKLHKKNRIDSLTESSFGCDEAFDSTNLSIGPEIPPEPEEVVAAASSVPLPLEIPGEVAVATPLIKNTHLARGSLGEAAMLDTAADFFVGAPAQKTTRPARTDDESARSPAVAAHRVCNITVPTHTDHLSAHEPAVPPPSSWKEVLPIVQETADILLAVAPLPVGVPAAPAQGTRQASVPDLGGVRPSVFSNTWDDDDPWGKKNSNVAPKGRPSKKLGRDKGSACRTTSVTPTTHPPLASNSGSELRVMGLPDPTGTDPSFSAERNPSITAEIHITPLEVSLPLRSRDNNAVESAGSNAMSSETFKGSLTDVSQADAAIPADENQENDHREYIDVTVERDKLSRKWGWSLKCVEERIWFTNIKGGTPAAQSQLLVGMYLHTVNGEEVFDLEAVGEKIKNSLSVQFGVWFDTTKITSRNIEGKLYRCKRHGTTPDNWQAVPRGARNYWLTQEFLIGSRCCGKPRRDGRGRERTLCPFAGIELCGTWDPMGSMFIYCPLCKEEYESLETEEERKSVVVLCWKCNADRIEDESQSNKEGRRTSRRL